MRTAITRRSRAIEGLLFLLGLSYLVVQYHGVMVSAQDVASTGVTVTPSRVTLQINKGASSGLAPVSVRNDYAQPVEFEAEVWGVKQLHDGSLAPTAEPEAALKDLLSVAPRSFTLEPKQSINLQIVARDSDKLAPGGHYAAVLIRQANAVREKLSLSPAVTVMAFIIKEDGAVRKLSAASIVKDGPLLGLPDRVTVDFLNEGNLSVVPRASVQVRGPNGDIFKTGVLNQESLWALPSEKLKLQAILSSSARAWLPGRYSTHVLYRYDESDDMQEIVTTNWVFPPLSLLAVVVLFVLIAVLVRLFKRLIRRRRPNHTVILASRAGKRKSIDGIL